MNGLLQHSLDLKFVQLLIKHLTEIHDHRLMNLLPEMGTKDLNNRDLQRQNLTVHENACQIKHNALENQRKHWHG